MKTWFVIATVVLTAALGFAQATQASAATPAPSQPTAATSMQPAVFTPADVKWAQFIPGVQLAVLSGDPNGTGPFTVRLKMVDGNVLAPHWHPEDENVTVISGTLQVGMGDKFDANAVKALPIGSHVLVPKQMHHYAKASGETIVEVYGQGPFKINYVNPADDPTAKH